MALNPSTNPTMAGRFTAADTDYPYGSAKNESAPGAGDGTPYFKARADDIFGFQQALLRSSGLTPSGNADTAPTSQYLQSIIQQVIGRGFLYNDTGAADAYIAERRTNQQVPGAVFEGMRFAIVPDNANTGASTLDISDLLNQAAGTTVIDIKLEGGVTDPGAGDIVAGVENYFIYRTSPGVHAELERGDITLATKTEAQAHTDNQKYMSSLRVYEAFQQYGLGYATGTDYQESTDADNLTKAGFYYLTNTAANGPSADDYSVLVWINADTNNLIQEATRVDDPSEKYIRVKAAGVWGGWVNITPIGVNQTWQDVSASRSAGVTYTNTTGKPIQVNIGLLSNSSSGSGTYDVLIDGVSISPNSWSNTTWRAQAGYVIPAGSTYRVNVSGTGAVGNWAELR